MNIENELVEETKKIAHITTIPKSKKLDILKSKIDPMRALGYKYEAIAGLLQQGGLQISEDTLRSYVSRRRKKPRDKIKIESSSPKPKGAFRIEHHNDGLERYK